MEDPGTIKNLYKPRTLDESPRNERCSFLWPDLQAALEDVKRLRDLEPKNLAAQKLLREVKEDRADGPWSVGEG